MKMLPNGRTEFPPDYPHKRPSSPHWIALNKPDPALVETAQAVMQQFMRQCGVRKI